MNNIVFINVRRFIFLIALQILVLKGINLGGDFFNYISIIIFPILIFLLPLDIPAALVIFIGFMTGLIVDISYDSLGINAAACTFVAFVRPLVIAILEPQGGYKDSLTPTKRNFGFNWYFPYVSIMLFVYLFTFFSIEAFSFVYIVSILKRTICSFIFSLIFILIYSFIFDPE